MANKITVTNVVPGTVNIGGSITTAYTFSSFPSGWARPGTLLFTGTCYLLLGYPSTNYTTIYRCTDLTNFATWTAVTVPSGSWTHGAVSSVDGTIVLAGTLPTGPDVSTCYSTDDGLTWNTGSTFTGCQVYSIAYGNKFIIGFNSLTTGRQSTDGITWSTISLLPFSTSAYRLLYSPQMDLWFTPDPSANIWRSTDGTATSWTNISSTIKAGVYGFLDTALINESGQLVCQVRTGLAPYLFKTYVSSDGYNFNLIHTSTQSSDYLFFAHSTFANVATGNVLFNSSDAGKYFFIRNDTLYRDSTSSGTGSGSIRLPENFCTSPHPVAHGTSLPMVNILSNVIYKLSFNLDNAESSSKYVDVTATKGSTTLTKRLPISLVNSNSDIYTLQVNPSEIILGGSENGVVPSSAYTNAKSEVTVLKNGIPQTGWTITASDSSGATLNTVTDNVIRVTAMSAGSSKSNISIVVNNSSLLNLPTLVSTLVVTKGVTSGWAGLASSFTKFSTNTNTYIALKFLPTGYFQIKYGSGGTYNNAGIWYGPIDSTGTKGASYYIIVNYTGATVTTGTGGVLGGGSWTTWNQMNTSREYILSDASTGTHTANLSVALATNSSGDNAVIGTGGLELVVP